MTRTIDVLTTGAMFMAMAFAPRAHAQVPTATTPAAPAPAPAAAPAAEAAPGASASAGSQRGLQLGLRLGYGIPFGKTVNPPDLDLSNVVSGQLPIWLDIGYRFNPNIYVGVYGQYGIAFVNDKVPDCRAVGVSCSANDLRFGVNAHYHFSPGRSMDPWAGLGIGYEIGGLSTSATGSTDTTSYEGLEFLNLQAGLDFSVARGLAIGPFASFSLGKYSASSGPHYAASGSGGGLGRSDDKAMHEWLVIGVRGAYNL